MTNLLIFLGGACVGAIFGMFCMALFVAAKHKECPLEFEGYETKPQTWRAEQVMKRDIRDSMDRLGSV